MNVICENTLLPAQMKYAGEFEFHTFWKGTLSEKHFNSLLSCKLIHNRPINLWYNGIIDSMYEKIKSIASIKCWNWTDMILNTPLLHIKEPTDPVNLSDYIRMLLLYKYGGIWFDLDVIWIAPIDGVLNTYKNQLCVYRWENQFYPNNAIVISINSQKELKLLIEKLIKRNSFGFQSGNEPLLYSTNIPITVLPCIWFDRGWVNNSIAFGKQFMTESPQIPILETLLKDSVCFHWHNNWEVFVHPSSHFMQLMNQIKLKYKE